MLNSLILPHRCDSCKPRSPPIPENDIDVAGSCTLGLIQIHVLFLDQSIEWSFRFKIMGPLGTPVSTHRVTCARIA
jgi:hypothetical protein